jgi:exopolysaccharide production protein ExoQ
MHETARVQPHSIARSSSELLLGRGFSRWLQVEFWLPIVVVLSLVLAISADRGYAASGGEEVYNPRMTSNSVRQLAFLGLGCTGFYLLTLARPAAIKPQAAWTILIPTLCLTVYILASILWSDDAVMTMKRAVTASLLIVAGLGIGRVWSMQDYAWGIIVVSSVLLALGVAVELYFRSFLSSSEYRFSGLFHPAKQSFNCGFLLLASLSIYFSHRRSWVLVIAATALAFLILTKARTGTAAALLACAWLTWHYTSIRGWLMMGVAGLGLGAAGLLFYQGTTGRELDATRIATMGRNEEAADPTKLTGRFPIWAHAFNEYTQQPVLGYGYGAYWTKGRLEEFERLNGWPLYHSHSTYLESLLNLGLVGFVLGLITLAITFHRSITLSRQGDGLAILVSSLLILAFLGGLFEIAFIGLEYESLVPMIGIGVMVFATPLQRRAVR